jgi:hypothetical protein
VQSGMGGAAPSLARISAYRRRVAAKYMRGSPALRSVAGRELVNYARSSGFPCASLARADSRPTITLGHRRVRWCDNGFSILAWRSLLAAPRLAVQSLAVQTDCGAGLSTRGRRARLRCYCPFPSASRQRECLLCVGIAGREGQMDRTWGSERSAPRARPGGALFIAPRCAGGRPFLPCEGAGTHAACTPTF